MSYSLRPFLDFNELAHKVIKEMNMSVDNVNHPTHYNSSNASCDCGRKIECIDVVRHMNFNTGNAIKYIWRYKHKNGIEDLKKAVWYLNDEITRLEIDNGTS